MSDPRSDQWPAEENRAVESNDYLIAFGQITLAYNLLESMMSRIFEHSAPLDSEYAKALFHSLNNRDRIDLLSAFIRHNEDDEDVCDRLLHCALCYDICTENRNILMHVILLDIDQTTAKWTKRASHDPNRTIEFHASLSDLRLVADQISDIFRYAWVLTMFLLTREKPSEQQFLQVALPGKPPKPRKLIPYQPEVIRANGKRPHRS